MLNVFSELTLDEYKAGGCTRCLHSWKGMRGRMWVEGWGLLLAAADRPEPMLNVFLNGRWTSSKQMCVQDITQGQRGWCARTGRWRKLGEGEGKGPSAQRVLEMDAGRVQSRCAVRFRGLLCRGRGKV